MMMNYLHIITLLVVIHQVVHHLIILQIIMDFLQINNLKKPENYLRLFSFNIDFLQVVNFPYHV